MRSNTKLPVKINTSETLASSPAFIIHFSFRTKFAASLKLDNEFEVVMLFHRPTVALIFDSELFQLVDPNPAPEVSPTTYDAALDAGLTGIQGA